MSISNIEKAAKIHEATASTKAYERLVSLFDAGSMTELDSLMASEGSEAEVITAFGTIEGVKAFAFSQNTQASGGAISSASAAKTCRLMRMAGEMGAPVIGIYDSNGARLKQAAKVLDASAAMLSASSSLCGVVPRISVVVGACIGANAILAANADLVICSKEAQYGIDTSGMELATDDAETMGSAHIISDNEMTSIASARKLVSMLPANNLEIAPEVDFAEPMPLSDAIAKQVSGDVEIAQTIIDSVADAGSFVELLGNFAKGVLTGFATIGGRTVGICVSRFGKNNGIICDVCAQKLARFVRMCDSFSLPVVTFVDAAGFKSVREGSVVAEAYSESTSVRVCVITGAAYGAAYMALASRSCASDVTLAWENAVISPLDPITAAAIMYSDKLKGCLDPINERARLVEEYKENDASAFSAARQGSIDDIITPSQTRARLIAELSMLEDKRPSCVQRKHSNMWL